MSPLERSERWTERKVFWDGREELYPLEVLGRGEGWLCARHITTRDYEVGPLHIPRGTLSYGIFVEGEIWVLYTWFGDGGPLGVYLNAAGEVRLGEGEVRWRDKILDVLYLPGGRRILMDYEEALGAFGEEADEILKSLKRCEQKALITSKTILSTLGINLPWWPL